MAQPGPKTSWEDLAHLGWSQQQVYDTLNPLRDYTMHGLSDLHLNEGIALSAPCYNVTFGAPYRVTKLVDHQVSEAPIPVAKFDNSNGSEPLTTEWTDTWSTTSTASLILTRGPSINLQWSVTIESVADSGFPISMSNNTSEIIEVESTKPLEKTFDIIVPAGETLEILRTELVTTSRSIYAQRYGLEGSIVATGDEYEGSEGWVYGVGPFLNRPGSDMQFVGLSQSSTFSHELVRNGDTQKASNPVVKVAKAITTTKPEDGKKTALQYAFAVAIGASKEGRK
ncbi:hypothetical protein F5146DRAFT_169679 [Armillaria mellea]|nr:hypothetical protein F5146DRAFT_1124806 [Armillaria mellea]KAK0186128.1 hypothetical protein F5146DRAFT_169679 [Armillaria mellea]